MERGACFSIMGHSGSVSGRWERPIVWRLLRWRRRTLREWWWGKRERGGRSHLDCLLFIAFISSNPSMNIPIMINIFIEMIFFPLSNRGSNTRDGRWIHWREWEEEWMKLTIPHGDQYLHLERESEWERGGGREGEGYSWSSLLLETSLNHIHKRVLSLFPLVPSSFLISSLSRMKKWTEFYRVCHSSDSLHSFSQL